ncbi:hypothetical protein HYALB_00009298 [Hymenoscyphus albidus]|uniref:Uncharacterized protein n=1 Tax=Hymenoscyphus albidus TaxID=595503 RepID=A0A9N9LMH9_9HELO|nr:hypothetical protein HYALB_00009298 [Hymenoscyphus albidus]
MLSNLLFILLLSLGASLTLARPGKLEDLERFGLPDGLSLGEFLDGKNQNRRQTSLGSTNQHSKAAFLTAVPPVTLAMHQAQASTKMVRVFTPTLFATMAYTPSRIIAGLISSLSNTKSNTVIVSKLYPKPSPRTSMNELFSLTARQGINTGNAVDCKTTSTCSQLSISLNQSCVANGKSWDNAVQVSFEGKLGKLKEVLDIGGGLSLSHNAGGSEVTTICNAKSDTSSCSWSDQGCHVIWKAKRNRRIHGYFRRSCDKPRSGTNMPDTQPRADG